MLPFTTAGHGSLSLVMMPFLGGTQAEWTEVVDLLGSEYRCVTMDLPGFGAAANVAGYTVEAMTDHVIETLFDQNGLGRSDHAYVLIGHSMAGKVSAVVTRKLLASSGKPPEAMILVSPSPPRPEPMTDQKRTEMLKMFGGVDSEADRADAVHFITENVSKPLPEQKMKRAVDGVLTMERKAWAAWLEHGSKEDWSEYVGRIDMPVLLVAGEADGALGPSAQREFTLPHFPSAQLLELSCSHLAPLEQPDSLAAAIRVFLASNAA